MSLIFALLCIAQLAMPSPLLGLLDTPASTKSDSPNPLLSVNVGNPLSALATPLSVVRNLRSTSPMSSSVVVPKTKEVDSAIHSLSKDSSSAPMDQAKEDLDGANTLIVPVGIYGGFGGFGYPGLGYGGPGLGYGGYGWGR